MREIIKKVLKELNISSYIITENKEESLELFFIKKHLDMRRMKDFREFDVVVYRDVDDKRGFSSCKIYPSMTTEEIRKSFESAYLAASFAKNQYFELPKAIKADHIDMKSTIADKGLETAAKEFVAAAFEADKEEDVFLNSLELFVKKCTKYIETSEGTDVSYSKWTAEGEFVAQCVEPQDVETYQSFRYDNLDTEALKAKVERAFEMTKARAQATTSPKAGKYRVIISGQYMKNLFGFYGARSSAAMIYPGYSNYEIGTKAQGEDIKGDAFTITGIADRPYSSEGVPMKDRVILDKGTVKLLHGNTRFCYYLGVEPTGDYEDFKLEPGKVSLEEMKKKPYLQVVNFSDFQVDEDTGHFGGEVRLAFLFDGEKVTPVTHCSISGNLFEMQDNMILSSDVQIDNGYEGPFAVAIDDISVAG